MILEQPAFEQPVLDVKATCHGASPALAFVPPTIFVKFPFLMSLSFLREPEHEMHLPLRAVPQVEGGGGGRDGGRGREHASIANAWKLRVIS